jgi:hypothetical protein
MAPAIIEVTVTPPGGAEPMRRAGHTANLLTEMARAG